MKNAPIISIIIPAYNAQSTLERAVESIAQKDDIEIIIIENGSTDGTYELALTMAASDDRIIVEQSDKGVSKARNQGIKTATGKWIAFLDADDVFTEDAFEVFSKFYDSEAEIVVFGHNHGSKPVPVTKEEKLFKFGDLKDAQITMITNPTTYLPAFAKLFRRKSVEFYKTSFDTDMSLSEDSDFVIRFILESNCIVFSEEIVYNYTVDTVSTMRSYNPDRVKLFLHALYRTSYKIRKAPSAVRMAYARYVLLNFNIMMVHGPFSVENRELFFTKLHVLKRASEVPIVTKSLKCLRLSDLKNLRMIPVILVKFRFYMLASFVYQLRAWQNSREMK